MISIWTLSHYFLKFTQNDHRVNLQSLDKEITVYKWGASWHMPSGRGIKPFFFYSWRGMEWSPSKKRKDKDGSAETAKHQSKYGKSKMQILRVSNGNPFEHWMQGVIWLVTASSGKVVAIRAINRRIFLSYQHYKAFVPSVLP